MKISIITPTYNEENNISRLIHFLRANDRSGKVAQIIVVDGGSTDSTATEVEALNEKIIICPNTSRAAQMNMGAKKATEDILYFVHADVLPPKTYVEDILQARNEGFELGTYRFKFNSNKKTLRFNSYMTQFDRLFCRGGDQTLFITQTLFDKINGFDERFVIMEDYDILIRARKLEKLKIIPKDVLVSARKYENNSFLRVTFANTVVFTMFYLKFSPQKIKSTYYKLLKHPKD